MIDDALTLCERPQRRQPGRTGQAAGSRQDQPGQTGQAASAQHQPGQTGQVASAQRSSVRTGPPSGPRRQSGQTGQAALFMTFSLLALLGMVGLVVDVGWAYWRKEAAKGAARAAVQAAAVAAKTFSSCNVGGISCQQETACPVAPHELDQYRGRMPVTPSRTAL